MRISRYIIQQIIQSQAQNRNCIAFHVRLKGESAHYPTPCYRTRIILKLRHHLRGAGRRSYAFADAKCKHRPMHCRIYALDLPRRKFPVLVAPITADAEAKRRNAWPKISHSHLCIVIVFILHLLHCFLDVMRGLIER